MAEIRLYHKKFTSLLLIVLLLYGSLFSVKTSKAYDKYDFEKRACWFSFLDMQIYLKDKSEEEFVAAIDEIYAVMLENDINTVIMHVRPMGDAVYASDYFPWSEYISTDRLTPYYDPLLIMIEEAHKMGLYFEAWVNPYRLSRDNESTESYMATRYYDMYKDFIVSYESVNGENCLSLDPARDESRELVVNGVREIVERYDVDGIHFDDYFYIDNMLPDVPVSERMLYVNSMVSQVYECIKEIDSEVSFGISPAGNVESARNQGADIDTWLSTPGYIDYIMPQIYWSDTFITNDGIVDMFYERASAWSLVNKLDIPMHVGLALYKAGEESAKDTGWFESSDNLSRQINEAYNLGYDGYALFRYEWLLKDISRPELDNLKTHNLQKKVSKIKTVIDDIVRISDGIRYSVE